MTEPARISDPAARPAGPDRSTPQALIDLAVAAIRHGADDVALCLEGLDSDFPAPIGWMLWITHREADSEERATLVCHRPGRHLDTATISPRWLTDAIAAEATETVIDSFVELFEAGVRSGWEMTYERDRIGFDVRRASAGVDERVLPMLHRLSGKAPNWQYNAAARRRGEKTSTDVRVSAYEGRSAGNASSTDGWAHRRVDAAHVESLLRAQAPNHALMGYFDEERDEWVR